MDIIICIICFVMIVALIWQGYEIMKLKEFKQSICDAIHREEMANTLKGLFEMVAKANKDRYSKPPEDTQ